MAKTIYEGLIVGKNGGERWSGTIQERGNAKVARSASSGRFTTDSKKPKGGSVIRSASANQKKN